MTGTILRVYRYDSGRIYLCSDIPDNMSDEERAELVSAVRLAMCTKLQGTLETAVNACIRQLAFGAVLCSPNLREAVRSFRDEADLLLTTPR